MIRSMTGYGNGQAKNDYYNFKVEMKSVNHRYNNTNIKLPYHINHLEDYIKKIVEKEIKRGSLDVYINLEYIDESAIDIKVDMNLAKSYKVSMESINEELGLNNGVSLENIISMPEVFIREKKEIDDKFIVEPLEDALKEALKELITMRISEGEELKLDILKKIDKIESYLLDIENKAENVVLEYKDKLEASIKKILDDASIIDEDKLNNEVAFFADKASIDEEIVRLKSHMVQFRQILDEEEPIGRKLDFLIQEINREINTIGSKSSDISISKNVVNIKFELEKIREQVQNIE